METNVLAVTLTSAAILVGVAGKKFTLPGGVEMNGNAEKILLKTGMRYSSEENRTLLKKKIAQANLNFEPEYFMGLQIALPILSAIALMPLVMFGLMDIYWLVLPAIILFVGPRVWLNSKAKSRVAKINKDLPEFCITLSAVLDAGADILMAITEVAYNMKGELGKEWLRATDNMAVGKRFTDALFEMSARCGVPDLTDLVRKIDQAKRYDTPLADAVRQHAQQMMLRRKHDGQRKAGELAIKLLFPVVIFVLLPMLGMLFFPVMYHMLNAY